MTKWPVTGDDNRVLSTLAGLGVPSGVIRATVSVVTECAVVTWLTVDGKTFRRFILIPAPGTLVQEFRRLFELPSHVVSLSVTFTADGIATITCEYEPIGIEGSWLLPVKLADVEEDL